MRTYLRTLTSPVGPFCGKGLHSGGHARMMIRPAPAGSGVVFWRRSGEGQVGIPARLEFVQPTRRCTVLARGRTTVATVEHVLAALVGLGIFDAAIDLDGPEVPIMDGSAAPFARALLRASEPTPNGTPAWEAIRSFHQGRGQASCHLLPARRLEIWCSVDFDHPLVGRQTTRHEERGAGAFVSRLAPARTFGFLGEADALRGAGLARGAGLNSVLVFHEGGLLNGGGTRFVGEPVRHKVLDALGDLALLGAPLRARIKLARCSHRMLTSTLRGAIQKGVLVRNVSRDTCQGSDQ